MGTTNGIRTSTLPKAQVLLVYTLVHIIDIRNRLEYALVTTAWTANANDTGCCMRRVWDFDNHPVHLNKTGQAHKPRWRAVRNQGDDFLKTLNTVWFEHLRQKSLISFINSEDAQRAPWTTR